MEMKARRVDRVAIAGAILAAACVAGSTGARAGDGRRHEEPRYAELRRIADTYAGAVVADGTAIGVGVGIAVGDRPPALFAYGIADAGRALAFSPDSIFEIGSVTKVFTTNLLGQAVDAGEISLDQTLSQFSSVLGTVPPLAGQVTIEELGDFTAGYPSLGLCSQPPVPGCLTSERPTIAQYGAADFAAYFQNTVPTDQTAASPPATSPPFPYFYSDFSIGLVGLLLGAKPDAPLDDSALAGWWSLTWRHLLNPLRMRSTYLDVPPSAAGRLVQGYSLALANPTVTDGQISAIEVSNPGGRYAVAPGVTIQGGGGMGATATATLDRSGGVASIAVQNGGSGYIPKPLVTFSGVGATQSAQASAVVLGDEVVGIEIVNSGKGYTVAPAVTITGGRSNGPGHDATAVAHIANGQVSFVGVTDAGAGYVQPLSVSVAPGEGSTSTIPIWAPAGALHSTIRDMARFVAAAAGESRVGRIQVDPRISAGFAVAETPYACSGASPVLESCTPPAALSGLAWAITPADQTNGFPQEIAKNGLLSDGFSTQVLMLPAAHMAVVVFVNSYQNKADTGEQTGAGAEIVARNILNAIYYTSAR